MKSEEDVKRDSEGKFAKGSKRPANAGRKKGTKNKHNTPASERAEELGVDPFEMLLWFCKGDFERLGYSKPIPMETRFNAIKEACTYILPKKRSVEVVQESQEDLPERNFAMPDPKGVI